MTKWVDFNLQLTGKSKDLVAGCEVKAVQVQIFTLKMFSLVVKASVFVILKVLGSLRI